MLASLNLQLLSATTNLDGSNESAGTGTHVTLKAESSSQPFANILAGRTEILPDQAKVAGEFLPMDGKPLPPEPMQDPITPQFAVPAPEIAGDEQGPLHHDKSFVPDLWADALTLTPVAGTPEININTDLNNDLDLDLVVVYPAVEAGIVGPEIATLPTVDTVSTEVRLGQLDMLTADDRARPVDVNRGGPLQAPKPVLDPLVAAAVTAQTDKLRAPGSEPAVVLPVSDGPVREKTPTTLTPSAKPVITTTNAALQPDEPPVETLRRNSGRVAGAIETVATPDTRVAAVSPSQHTAPTTVLGHAALVNIDASPGRPAMLTDTINTPVRDNAWGEKLGERVLMMTGKQLQTAEIRLTPADLGPVRVRVSVEEGAANVTFHAQQAVTREAIEQALPRLREMLSENGLSLGQTDVSEQGVADDNGDNELGSNPNHESQDELTETAHEQEPGVRRKSVTSSNLLDTYA